MSASTMWTRPDNMPEEGIVLVDEALERLQKKDPELAQMVMSKFFVGLTNSEIAQMAISRPRIGRLRSSQPSGMVFRDVDEWLHQHRVNFADHSRRKSLVIILPTWRNWQTR